MKRAPIPALMWFVVLLLCAYMSIADPAKTNDTATSVCDGSVQDCLIDRQLEAEFSTITSSHFGRMLADQIHSNTAFTSHPHQLLCPDIKAKRYRDCFPRKRGGEGVDRCSNPYNRDPSCPR